MVAKKAGANIIIGWAVESDGIQDPHTLFGPVPGVLGGCGLR